MSDPTAVPRTRTLFAAGKLQPRPWRPRSTWRPYPDTAPMEQRRFWWELRRRANAASWRHLNSALVLLGASVRLSRNILPAGGR